MDELKLTVNNRRQLLVKHIHSIKKADGMITEKRFRSIAAVAYNITCQMKSRQH
jgi:hypothetical protein